MYTYNFDRCSQIMLSRDLTVYIPTSSIWDFLFPHSFRNTRCCQTSGSVPIWSLKYGIQCSFILHFYCEWDQLYLCILLSHFCTLYVTDIGLSLILKLDCWSFILSYLIREYMCMCLYNMTCQYFSSSLCLWWNFLLKFGFIFSIFEWSIFYSLI